MAFRPSLTPLSGNPVSTVAGLGCAPIGNLFSPVADEDAIATVARAVERGIGFFDTAPHYGAGESERRLGLALSGTPRDDVVIATKVGRRIVDSEGAPVRCGAVGRDTVGDLSRDGVLRSLDGSLARLRTDRIDLLYLHDPADVDVALREAVPALTELRDQGVVRAIGVGMVHVDPLVRFVSEGSFDVVMPAGRLTLLDRSAEAELLPLTGARDVGIIVAGVFNSGILADPVATPYFDYHEASAQQRARALAFEAVCEAWGVPLPWVAARFPLRYAEVDAIVVGARTVDEVDSFVDGAVADVPEGVWADLEEAVASAA